ncbi:hypothetical protein [Pseudorhodoplanes sinuspersici]|uniref:hypothetical protein n=1 Tax=Pseudorhodoplanes sinuspersici TaxID=1235591 RepID=UPI0011C47C2F|nr:hypothetical protein [Pseudorhodoplanes sinuspersici]
MFIASFFRRNIARIVAVFAVLFAALPGTPGSNAPTQPSPDNLIVNAPSAAETFARWLQPSAAAAATRKRQRTKSTRVQETKTEDASETSPEQSSQVLAPLTPFIQIWPQAHTARSEVPEAMTQLPSHDFMRVAGKADRLLPTSGREEEIVEADELSELDRAAAPLQPAEGQARAQAVAFAGTDGRATRRDNGDSTTPANRFAAFADSVKALPQAPWFDSILFVIGGAVAAFAAARVFMRA